MMNDTTDEKVLVPRAELLAWAKAWLDDYGPNDGTDCVTPFDLYLMKAPAEAQAQGGGEWPIVDVAPEHSHIPCAKYPDLFEYHLAMSGEGDHAYTWSDKPHRLVYNLTREASHLRDRITALSAPQPAAVKAAVEEALQRWLDWCAEHGEQPEAASGAATVFSGITQQGVRSDDQVEVKGFDEWFDEYTKDNYTDEMLALAAWKQALAQQPAADTLADTQRAIIEAAERRGYERAMSERPVSRPPRGPRRPQPHRRTGE